MTNDKKRWSEGMRDAFFDSLFEIAKKDKNVILITADTGAICHDKFKAQLKDQYINAGIAEQNMIGVAAGLAMAGKKVYVYAITPFATARCFEQIKVDLCCMDLDVTVVGIGAGFDYSTLGPTHHGTEDIALMRILPLMKIYSPSDNIMASLLVELSYKEKGPKYIRLDRTGLPLIYKNTSSIDVKLGFNVLKKSNISYIFATGRMVDMALKVSERFKKNINLGVVDIFRIKPVNIKKLWELIGESKLIITLEEHFLEGGLSDIIGKILLEKNKHPLFKPIGIKNSFCREYGNREILHSCCSIDIDSVTAIVSTVAKLV